MVSDKLALLVGTWVAACKTIVEEHHGEIDKYRGDGFLAYWREDEKGAGDVAAALAALKQVQVKKAPRFRIALHFGLVAVGGMESMGEESLMGKEVNFVFRMEKLAGSLGIECLTSVAAYDKLGALIASNPAGAHELKGIDQPAHLYRVVRPSGVRGRFQAANAAGGLATFVATAWRPTGCLSRWWSPGPRAGRPRCHPPLPPPRLRCAHRRAGSPTSTTTLPSPCPRPGRW